ncbi:MAG: glycosyltransferase [Pseudomonadota bacterium]
MIELGAMEHDDSLWEVPSFDEAIYGARRHGYALVIPVINEGERIRAQIKRIQEAHLSADVVIADGGSSDGSLDAAFVSEAGVRAVLTKTGPGKLSAQLRMAYAWCIRQGYTGIVTIDGNGKDGVEAVENMVAMLRDGFDYVQGSRYLPGGVAENTPLERTIGNRIIHAPMLSLAGRHWFSDTTNGFRAYSVRYLCDPRVRPFRDVFQRYELLFYLTVRAGQIGMKVGQVPVERRYPQNAAVPTKITGTSAKLQVLGQAVDAATGGYTPDAGKAHWVGWFAPIAVLIVTVIIVLSGLASPAYSPDSWAYYELSKTVFDDFYKFTHFRTYWSESEYSSSFPPLFAVLIAGTDATFQFGARTGYILCFAAFLAFAFLSERISRRSFDAPLIGLGVALVLLLDPRMLLSEMLGGRSIPIQLLLYAVVLMGMLHFSRLSILGAGLIGMVTGLAILNRFDALFLPALVAVGLLYLTRRPVLAVSIIFGASLAVSPWVAYSLTHFGTAFVTDNSTVAKAIDARAFVTDWWPSAQPSVSDDVGAWLSKLFRNTFGLMAALARVVFSLMSLSYLVALAPLVAVIVLVRIGNGYRLPLFDTALRERFRALVIFILIMLVILVPQILTGYFDRRYFTAFAWVVFLFLATRLVARGQTVQQRRTLGQIFFLTVVAIALPFSAFLAVREAASDQTDLTRWERFSRPPILDELRSCIDLGPDDRILVLGNDRLAARLGAQGNLRMMMEPRNMRDGRLDDNGSRAFLRQWEPNYVLVANPNRRYFAETVFPISPVPECGIALYGVLSGS